MYQDKFQMQTEGASIRFSLTFYLETISDFKMLPEY
jgi:hypothetical protein